MKRLCLAFIAILTLSAPATAAAPRTIYTDVTLIDGTGAAPKLGMAIVVQGQRIEAIAPAKNAARFKGTVRDMKGAFALPGLIDSHVHLATPPDRRAALAELRRNLYSGVTAVRDMAGDARLLADLSNEARDNEIPSPDIYYAALVAGPAFFRDPRVAQSSRGYMPGTAPFMHGVDVKTDLPLLIAASRGSGATGLKIYADVPPLLVDRLTIEAHKQHLMVWDHAAVFPTSPREVIDSGADTVSHACMLAYQSSAKMPPAYHHRPPVEAAKFKGASPPEVQSLLADMKQRGTILDATVYVYKAMWDVPRANPPPYCTLALAARLTGEAHKAGVNISTGTDAPSHWQARFPSLYDELSLLVHSAGFTPAEALRASSAIGAAAIGQQKDIGTLAQGKLADIVFTTKDPTQDIANLKSIVSTVKRGQEYKRADYKPVMKDEMGE